MAGIVVGGTTDDWVLNSATGSPLRRASKLRWYTSLTGGSTLTVTYGGQSVTQIPVPAGGFFPEHTWPDGISVAYAVALENSQASDANFAVAPRIKYVPAGTSVGIAAWSDVTGKPTTFPPTAHNHDDRYFTETEADGRYSATGHNHDERYYTATATNSLIAAANLVPVNARTAAYTLALADAGLAVEVTSASTADVTVPPSSSVSWATGTVIEVARLGTGAVTIQPGAGVTIQAADSLRTLRAQNSTASLRYRGSNTWLLAGDLS